VLGRNETLGIAVRCPRGQRAVGYGARLAGLTAGGGARASGLGAVGGIQIVEAMPTRRGLLLVLRNLGAPGAARVYARCLARVARAGSRGRSRPRYRRSVILPLRSFAESVGARRAQGFSHGCGRFRLALGAWHAIPRQRNVFLLSSFPRVSAGGSWTLLSFEPASTAVTLALRCVDVRSAWVRVR
jgi:hypothetical protein